MKLYRGGTYRTGMAFFTRDPKVAHMYGKVHAFESKRALKLFKVTHASIKKVFKYLSSNLVLLLKFIFGTDTTRSIQSNILKKITGKGSRVTGPGQRLSLTEIDSIAFAAFCKEYVNKHGYDGIYVPPKFTQFHRGGTFHSEIFISRRGLLNNVPYKTKFTGTKQTARSFSIRKDVPLSELYTLYTKGTRSLLKPFRHFVPFLGGGMAVKLYLGARGIKTAIRTSDFDFKFAVPRTLKTKTRIDKLSNEMYSVIYNHVSGFVRFLNRNGYGPAELYSRELKGVPIDKPGGPNYKKVYRVYNFSIKINGRTQELVDTSLVVVPGVTRRHLSLKWSRKFGFPIQTLTRLWKDTLYVLAGSFVHKKIMLRNPINGEKKEKGIKNAIRAGHLSYLTSKRRGTAHLVWLARRLIEDIAARDKKAGVRNSRQIMGQLKLMQILNLERAHQNRQARARK